MIAAIYARKSTEQDGAGDKSESVERQIANARAYAERQGWTVEDRHVYFDDAISGAEFVERPGYTALMAAVTGGRRPAFEVVVMSDQDRLGRDMLRTATAVRDITEAGVRIFTYLDASEITAETLLDQIKVVFSGFAGESERVKARQRTRDALVRKFNAGHVVGGRVYGYTNVEHRTVDGTRTHVTRAIDEEQAGIVRRIFALYASGIGTATIAATLNRERIPSPRGNGWLDEAIRVMLMQPLYAGVTVYGQTENIVRGGTTRTRTRPESEWLRLERPELRIIPEALWEQVRARFAQNRALYVRTSGGRLLGRPAWRDASDYLLTGFAQCHACGGPMACDQRVYGTGANRYPVKVYACMRHRNRGPCANGRTIRVATLDAAVLGAITDRLDEGAITEAIGIAAERIAAAQASHPERQQRIARELEQIERRLKRGYGLLLDADDLAEGLKAELREAEARKLALIEEQAGLEAEAQDAASVEEIRVELRARFSDARVVLAQQTPQARQMLRRLLGGSKIVLEPTEDGYKFFGHLAIGGLLSGQTRGMVGLPSAGTPSSLT